MYTVYVCVYIYKYITICFYLFLHRSYRAWPIRLPRLDQITGPMVQGSPAYPNNTTWMIHVTTPWWEMISIWRLLFDPWHCTFPIVSVCVCLCVALQKRNKNIKSKWQPKSKLLNTWSIIFISSKVGLRLPQVHSASLQKNNLWPSFPGWILVQFLVTVRWFFSPLSDVHSFHRWVPCLILL